MTDELDSAALASRCRTQLGDPAGWQSPPGYPASLGLCVLDSVWSIGVRYDHVEGVLRRYRALRRSDGATPETDSAADLRSALTGLGTAPQAAEALDNRQLTSTRSGILKAEAVALAADALVRSGISTCQELLALDDAGRAEVRRAWTSVKGQRSGLSWAYLLLLAGAEEVKPDRMILRFVEGAIGRRPSRSEAARLVSATAAELGVSVRTLDHRIWRVQSERETAGAEAKTGDSGVQREAEAMILERAGVQLGVPPLQSRRVELAPGVAVEVDGASDGVLVEIFARQGSLKPAQKKKVAQDILKFRVLREVETYRDHRMLVVFASHEARDSVTGWLALAAETAGVEMVVVDIEAVWRDRLRAAQAKQFMASSVAVGDFADDSADMRDTHDEMGAP